VVQGRRWHFDRVSSIQRVLWVHVLLYISLSIMERMGGVDWVMRVRGSMGGFLQGCGCLQGWGWVGWAGSAVVCERVVTACSSDRKIQSSSCMLQRICWFSAARAVSTLPGGAVIGVRRGAGAMREHVGSNGGVVEHCIDVAGVGGAKQ